MSRFIIWARYVLSGFRDEYDLGHIENGTPARRNRRTGEVRFILWPDIPGEMWYRVGDGHVFTKNDSDEVKS